MLYCCVRHSSSRRYLQIGVLHQLQLLLDVVQLLLLGLDVSLQNPRALLQLLLQLMHHPQRGRKLEHGLLKHTDTHERQVSTGHLNTHYCMSCAKHLESFTALLCYKCSTQVHLYIDNVKTGRIYTILIL